MNTTAAAREMRVFRLFAEHGPLRVDQNSIESRDAPDIVCTLEGGERIAFELVELIDQEFARRTSILGDTFVMLKELTERLPSNLKSRLEERLGGGAYISFEFAGSLAVRAREEATLDALEWLLQQPGKLEGTFDEMGPMASRVRRISVLPWKWPLRLETNSSGHIGDPTLARLRSKFEKDYRSEHPIELLMYTEMDLLLPEDVWIEKVKPFVTANLADSPFRRVWLFKCGARSVTFVFPPLELT